MDHVSSSFPTSQDQTEESPIIFGKKVPWHPPLPIWKLYLRFLFSIGLYSLIWTYSIARDIHNHLDSKVRPWHYLLMFFLPFGMVFAGVRQAKQIRLLGMSNAQTELTNPWLIGILLFFMAIFTFATNRTDEYIIWLIWLFVFPIPWLLLQHQVNIIKDSLILPNWILPTRFSKIMKKLGIFVGILILILFGIGFFEQYPRFAGKALSLGQTVEDADGLYSIRIPGVDWKRTELGTLAIGTALEIYGPTINTWAISYVHTNWTLDEAVNARRVAMQENAADITFTEHREFIKTALVPISHRVFTTKDPLWGDELYWWVSTIETEDRTIELIVHTSEELKVQVQAEMLAKSLSLINRK